MDEMPFVPKYPGEIHIFKDAEVKARTFEIFAPAFLEEAVTSALVSLKQRAEGSGFQVICQQLPPDDPNLYFGLGREVALSELAEPLQSLSLCLAPLHLRSARKLRPLMIYIYDLAPPMERFRLPEGDIGASLIHFDHRRGVPASTA